MILFKGKKFSNYIDFQDYLIRNDEIIHEGYFEHSDFFYIRSLINENFNKQFSVKQIKQLIKEELALKTITRY